MKNKPVFLRVSEQNIDKFAQRLSKLYLTVRKQKREPDFWKWRYFKAPLKQNILFVALCGRRVMGMFGTLYLPLTLRGRIVKAGFMDDLVIHPSERSWSYFIGLEEAACIESRNDNAPFHFGVSSGNLIELHQLLGAVSVRHISLDSASLNATRIWESRFMSYPLSGAGCLLLPAMGLRNRDKKTIGLHIRYIEKFNSAFDELWDSLAARRTVAIVKNAAYLNWRYAGFLGSRFIRLAAYQKNRLEGLIIFSTAHPNGPGKIFELLARGDNPEVMGALLSQAFLELRKKNIDRLIADFPDRSQTHSVLKKAGFKFPDARIDSNLYMIVSRFLKERSPALDIKNWNFSLGDWMIS